MNSGTFCVDPRPIYLRAASSGADSTSTASSASTTAMAPLLPSPNDAGAVQSATYFGSIAAAQTQQSIQQSGALQQNQQQQQLQHQSQTTQSSQSAAFVGQRGGSNGGAPETAPYLQDFSLVAEAAKRAQLACLTRDLGDIGL